jgi:hypothetical protein
MILALQGADYVLAFKHAEVEGVFLAVRGRGSLPPDATPAMQVVRRPLGNRKLFLFTRARFLVRQSHNNTSCK